MCKSYQSINSFISPRFPVDSPSMRVVVIGAGPSGLCALRYLADKPELYDPVAFEKMDSIGGTWVYTDQVGLDKYGMTIHSSMYKNLR